MAGPDDSVSELKRGVSTGNSESFMDNFDIDKPLWSQDTLLGRFKHYLWVTDPRTCLVPTTALYDARKLVEDYR